MAISETTSTSRKRERERLPEEPRPLDLRTELRSLRRLAKTGARPNTIPVATETSKVKPRTRQSIPTSESRGRAAGAELLQDGNAPEGQQQADQSTGQRHDHAFGEELASEAPWIGAQGRTHGDLFFAGSGASEQKVRNVGAGDQQHEQHRGEQRP